MQGVKIPEPKPGSSLLLLRGWGVFLSPHESLLRPHTHSSKAWRGSLQTLVAQSRAQVKDTLESLTTACPNLGQQNPYCLSSCISFHFIFPKPSRTVLLCTQGQGQSLVQNQIFVHHWRANMPWSHTVLWAAKDTGQPSRLLRYTQTSIHPSIHPPQGTQITHATHGPYKPVCS